MQKVFEIQSIKQVVQEIKNEGNMKVTSPEDAAEIAYRWIGEEDREVFLVMCLNVKNDVVALHKCHIGSLNSSIVHPREVFKAAILNNALSIICFHNHPSSNPNPSPEDLSVTDRLVKAGEYLGVEVLDHIIIGNNNPTKFYSLKEEGHM